ncbi:hypothetical protein PFISCL1PPCAC_10827, partial [Pristionchus fissidentatus]
ELIQAGAESNTTVKRRKRSKRRLKMDKEWEQAGNWKENEINGPEWIAEKKKQRSKCHDSNFCYDCPFPVDENDELAQVEQEISPFEMEMNKRALHCQKNGTVVKQIGEGLLSSNAVKCFVQGCINFLTIEEMKKHVRRAHWNECTLIIECRLCSQLVNCVHTHDCSPSEFRHFVVKLEYNDGFDHEAATSRELFLHRLSSCPFCSFISKQSSGPVRHMTITCRVSPHAQCGMSCVSLRCRECEEEKWMKYASDGVEHMMETGHTNIHWKFACEKEKEKSDELEGEEMVDPY